MKTNTVKQTKIIYLVLTILSIIIVTFIAFELVGVTHFFNPKTDQIIDDSKDLDPKTNDNQDNTNSQTDTTIDPKPSDILLSTRRETNGSVTIITQLTNYSDGVCDLTIANGDSIYTQTAPVLYQAIYSTCEGFNIPSDAVIKGTWKISLSVTSKGIVNTNSTSMEVQ